MRGVLQTRGGFTLIELMMVVILIGIFSALMVGEMRGTYEDALLRSTARKLIGGANLAASQAVALNRPHSLWIDRAHARMQVQMAGGTGTVEEEALDPRITIELRELLPPLDEDPDTPKIESGESAGNPERVEFFPDGTSQGREIALRDRMGVELLLRIDPVTGRIRVKESEDAR